MSTGKIVQIIGAVIDVEFPREQIPKIYEALKLEDVDLTLEVQQQLGDGVVRTIAMGVSEGLKRGLKVKATGEPDLRAGRQGDARPHHGRARRAAGRARSGARRRNTCRFIARRRPTTSRPAARSCSTPASRSSTC